MPSLNFNFNRNRSGGLLTGLDIQPGYVAAVEARVNGSIAVERAAGAALAADTVREGEVLDQTALTDVLRDLFRDSQMSRRVRIGVANQRTVLRTLELPPVTDHKELAAAVRFQAEDQVPMPLNNAVLDFQPLGIFDTPAGARQRVVLVAAQRDMVERLLTAVRDAGLKPEGVDLSAFALIRALYRASADQVDRVLYLNVGGLTNMAIAEGTVCRFTRVVGGGLEAMAVEVAERLEIPLDQARSLLINVGLPVPDPTAQASEAPTVVQELPEAQEVDQDLDTEPLTEDSASEQVIPEPPAVELSMAAQSEAAPPMDDGTSRVRMVLENGVREIAGEVRNSLDFHRSQEGGGTVSSVVLSGPALEIPGFAEMLKTDIGLPVHCETVHSVRDDSFAGVSPQRLAIATGLTAEEVHS